MSVSIDKHYLHREAPVEVSMGLWQGHDLFGVCILGAPSSAPLRSGLCGPKHCMDVIELNRLWVDDRAPKNSESRLIAATLRASPRPIVVSYADPPFGHVGTVYQATNWIYTGLSARRWEWSVDGVDLHSQTLADRYMATEIREKYGDRFAMRLRPRKHRYVFFACGQRERRRLRKLLRYEQQPYPKRSDS